MTPSEPSPSDAVSYPRQEALTRRFRLGVPRAFQIAPDGSRIAFLRSAHGRDPVNSLWVAEPDGRGGLVERVVVDARELVRPDADLPAAEKARRERMRESTSGITAHSTDRAVTTTAFSLDGVPFVAGLVAGAGRAVAIAHPGPVVDPRLSPDGRHVVYVHDGAVYAAAADGTGEPVLLAAPDTETESFGLADFVAAEELERTRGLWWLAGGDAVLAEWVDEAPVPTRWIADPANPDREPRAHRYPAAGTANPVARLVRLGLTGERAEVSWDREAYPYLATVETDDAGGAVVGVLSRDQQRMLILRVDADGTVTTLRERHTAPWVTIQGGVPTVDAAGRLLEIVADRETDTFRLVVDDVPASPAGLQVTGLLDADESGFIVAAQRDPRDQQIVRIAADGTITPLSPVVGVHSAAIGAGGTVIASSTIDTPRARFTARLGDAQGEIASVSELPVVEPAVTFAQVTERGLHCAVVWPTGHVPGSRRLPVVLAPYGGPHSARVLHASAAFRSDQWLADQGFAVVVVDNAGTPGRGPAFEFEVSGDLATPVLADQVAALQELGERYPDLDLERVGITGWSFGGYLAALAVLDRPDVFRAAVAGAPVTDWALYDTGYTERYLGTPQDQPDAYLRSSLIERAATLQRPLLLIHGLADDNVLAAHTLRLSSTLMAAGRPHSVLPLTGVTHMTPQEEVAENLLLLEVDFLRTHLA